MGRRAKHKQAAPEPLEPTTLFNKKSGKRKADVDAKSSQRPTKKLKDLNGKRITLGVKPSDTENRKEQLESEGSGWEDIDDLRTHSMLVGLCFAF